MVGLGSPPPKKKEPVNAVCLAQRPSLTRESITIKAIDCNLVKFMLIDTTYGIFNVLIWIDFTLLKRSK